MPPTHPPSPQLQANPTSSSPTDNSQLQPQSDFQNEQRSSPSPSTSYTTPVLDHPYSALSPQNTLNVYLPTTPLTEEEASSAPSYTLIYIHGGAFRDPLQTASSIVPSLPHLFSPPSSEPQQQQQQQGQCLAAVISLNYRLAPRDDNGNDDGGAAETTGSTTARREPYWPKPLNDIHLALTYLSSKKFQDALNAGIKATAPSPSNPPPQNPTRATIITNNLILAGHSVGATLAILSSLKPPLYPPPSSQSKSKSILPNIRALLLIAGIYDFTTLLTAHPSDRQSYENWITAAFGPQDEGGWDEGSTMRYLRSWKRVSGSVKKVLVAHSRQDEAVEIAQSEALVALLREREEAERGGERERWCEFVEVRGGHDEVIEGGVELCRCVRLLMRDLDLDTGRGERGEREGVARMERMG